MMKTNMDERILVCVYYGPNGERLITRGCKIAKMMDCPLYILTVDPQPEDEWDIEKTHFVERWKELAEQFGAEIIIKYNEKRPAVKVISEVVKQKNITQVLIGQSPHSRWEEITKRSFSNMLLSEIPFVDLHIISVARELKNVEGFFEKGIRAYLLQDENKYKLSFDYTSQQNVYEGIFYKEVGTDFNNGIFKFMKDGKVIEVQVVDDYVDELTDIDKERR